MSHQLSKAAEKAGPDVTASVCGWAYRCGQSCMSHPHLAPVGAVWFALCAALSEPDLDVHPLLIDAVAAARDATREARRFNPDAPDAFETVHLSLVTPVGQHAPGWQTLMASLAAEMTIADLDGRDRSQLRETRPGGLGGTAA